MSKGVTILVLLVIIGVWLIVGLLPSTYSSTIERAGLYGDSFGIVNSLMSGLALVGVIIAVAMQSKELHESAKSQRESAEAQRMSLQAQVDSINTMMLSSYINAAVSIMTAPKVLTIEQEQSLVRVRSAMELAEKRLAGALELEATPAIKNLIVDRLRKCDKRVRELLIYPQSEISRIAIQKRLTAVREELSAFTDNMDADLAARVINGVDDRLSQIKDNCREGGTQWEKLNGNLEVLANILKGSADDYAERNYK